MTIAPSPAGAPGPLERRVQRLTAAVAVLSVGLALSVLWRFIPQPDLNASRFLLRDSAGTWRGSLEMGYDGSPTMRLNDVRGRAMLYANVLPDGTPRFRLADSSGASRVVLEVYPDGTPHARLLGPTGRTGIHAWLRPSGQPGLDVRWGSVMRSFEIPDSSALAATKSPRDTKPRGH
jgi:hypothetical protein